MPDYDADSVSVRAPALIERPLAFSEQAANPMIRLALRSASYHGILDATGLVGVEVSIGARRQGLILRGPAALRHTIGCARFSPPSVGADRLALALPAAASSSSQRQDGGNDGSQPLNRSASLASYDIRANDVTQQPR